MTIAAYTKIDSVYPGYINISDTGDGVLITLRGDPEIKDSAYICGHSTDKGKPGRCTPGDNNCNNYCNSAPEKGPMQDSPKPCIQVLQGETTTLFLSKDEFKELLNQLKVNNDT